MSPTSTTSPTAAVQAPGDGDRTRAPADISLPAWLSMGAQLGLLMLLVVRFDVLHRAFYQVFGIAAAGALVHALLPLPWRRPAYVLLSIATLCFILKSASLWLLPLAFVLIGLCHLPVPFWLRGTLLVGTAVVLALLRSRAIDTEASRLIPPEIWPVLGSLFMFRLILYCYDLRTDRKGEFGFTRALSYFFMLPNVVFPLFPVIDYKIFTRTYYDADAARIYQKGLNWIFRGVVHLILYRIVYLHFTVPAEAVDSLAKLGRHMVAVYLLYLHVSGTFHLIVGMLCLFGFNLPETHHLYFLATSFNDYWRRINITWKDFMMKIFYYPIFFRLRWIGNTAALVLGTVCVFVLTWLLHQYQVFWILSRFPLRTQDLFWAFLGVLVVGNTLYDARRSRRKARKRKERRSWAVEWLLRGLRIAGLFALLTVAWSFWNSGSVAEWYDMVRLRGTPAPGPSLFGQGGLLPYAALFVGLGALTLLPAGERKEGTSLVPLLPRGALRNTLSTGAVVLLSLPAVAARLGSEPAAAIAGVRVARLSAEDVEDQERGYYENLSNLGSSNPALWDLYAQQPVDWHENFSKVAREDYLAYELLPMADRPFKGKGFHTNRWGMRDRDYAREKPAGAYRAAVLGSSYVMGSGVEDDENFEWLLEERLNDERGRGAPYQKYELLNFSVGGYGPFHQVLVMEEKVPPFQPDAVWYVAHYNDLYRVIDHIVSRRSFALDPPWEPVRKILEDAGVQAETSQQRCSRLLKPRSQELLAWAYGHIAAEARRLGAEPVWIFLPRLDETSSEESRRILFELAREAGFEIVDLSGVWDGVDVEAIRIAEYDLHPDHRGHELLMNALYEALRKHPRLSRIAHFR